MPPTVPSASGRASQAPWNNPTTAGSPAEAAPAVRTRLLDGLLTGLAASAIAGAMWWGVVVGLAEKGTQLELWHLGSILVGLIVGQGVLTGSRKGGAASGLLALVLSAATVAVTVYFIDRSQTIIALSDAGRSSDIPLWDGVKAVTDVYQGWWDFDRTRVFMWLAGPLIAVVIAGWPGRRPLVG